MTNPSTEVLHEAMRDQPEAGPGFALLNLIADIRQQIGTGNVLTDPIVSKLDLMRDLVVELRLGLNVRKAEPGALRPCDVVQLSIDVGNPMFACCMLTVTEVKPWGVQGYVQALGENGNPGGQAYYRAKWDEIELVGHAVWVADGSWLDKEDQ